MISIPKGAVPIGKKLHVEVAVAMYGPFIFPSEVDTRPISPILWLCFLEDDVQLCGPFQVTLPHFLTGLTNDKAQYFNVGFAKASHNYSRNCDGQYSYSFFTCDGQFTVYMSCGTLETMHCCFLCIKAEHTSKMIKEARYCLVRIEHCLSLCYFSSSHLLRGKEDIYLGNIPFL